jgi:hypothetical protein
VEGSSHRCFFLRCFLCARSYLDIKLTRNAYYSVVPCRVLNQRNGTTRQGGLPDAWVPKAYSFLHQFAEPVGCQQTGADDLARVNRHNVLLPWHAGVCGTEATQ